MMVAFQRLKRSRHEDQRHRHLTDTMEKMQKRIDCDLEYLRNWSLRLDIFIIFKTPLALLRRQNAY